MPEEKKTLCCTRSTNHFPDASRFSLFFLFFLYKFSLLQCSSPDNMKCNITNFSTLSRFNCFANDAQWQDSRQTLAPTFSLPTSHSSGKSHWAQSLFQHLAFLMGNNLNFEPGVECLVKKTEAHIKFLLIFDVHGSAQTSLRFIWRCKVLIYPAELSQMDPSVRTEHIHILRYCRNAAPQYGRLLPLYANTNASY